MNRLRENSRAGRIRAVVQRFGAIELGDLAREVDAPEPSFVRSALKDDVRAGRLANPYRGLYTVVSLGKLMLDLVNEYRRCQTSANQNDANEPLGDVAVGDVFEVGDKMLEVVEEHDGMFGLAPVDAVCCACVVMTSDQLKACKKVPA